MKQTSHLKIFPGLAALGLAGAMTSLQAQTTLTNSWSPIGRSPASREPKRPTCSTATISPFTMRPPSYRGLTRSGPTPCPSMARAVPGAMIWRVNCCLSHNLTTTRSPSGSWRRRRQSGPAAFSEGNSSDTSSAFILRDSDGTTLNPWLRDPANPTLLYTAAPVFDGNWHFIVYEQTNDPGTGYSGFAYIDGSLDANCTPYLCNGSRCLTGSAFALWS